VSPLRERGPHELRQLIERFNRMVADLVRIDQERNTMLAGIAHDLKTRSRACGCVRRCCPIRRPPA
jgi:two-component system osmolarity sensor histidine kinase EnvZ